MPYLFDEFRQADDRFSRKFGGTGLGLAIVKKYCQMLDGSIDVESTHGSGSEFVVTLPLKPSDFIAGSEFSEHSDNTGSFLRIETREKPGSGKTLLLVDDSEPQIIQLSDILIEEGFKLQVARNGREALDSIKKVIPDAMILDLQMPDVDGFEVLKEIRNLEETKSIPVLILTAKHISRSELGFLKENHIYQLIQKGEVNRNELLAHVINLVNQDMKSHKATGKRKVSKTKKDPKPSILVIEDNEDNLVTLRALLSEKFIITTATDGYDGLEKAISLSPDLILLDISLPGIDGITVFDEIRKNETLSAIPVIALTARAMKGDRENLLAYGFDGYISKPIDNETFEIKIREYLNY
ncbi:MAG: response regulator [Bacteroidetes bacterium]|nr:response regulator [Bacteroidota bacterium]